jgi:hypothetical protein
MDRSNNKPNACSETTMGLRAKDLCDIERYFREKGGSEFMYDEELDVFRFPEDGRFAFCDEFADWERLWQRAYLNF